jgi:hypothetical protein
MAGFLNTTCGLGVRGISFVHLSFSLLEFLLQLVTPLADETEDLGVGIWFRVFFAPVAPAGHKTRRDLPGSP